MTTARNQRIAPFPTMKNIKAKSFYVLKSFWVSILAVAIGTCLLSASLVFGDSIKSGMQTGARQLVGNADLVFEGTPKNHWRVDRGVLADIQSLDTNVSIQEFKQEACRAIQSRSRLKLEGNRLAVSRSFKRSHYGSCIKRLSRNRRCPYSYYVHHR